MRSYLLKGFYIIFISIYCNVGSLLAYASETFVQTEAKIEIVKDVISNLDLKDTVIAALIQATGKSLNDLLEDDKVTLISFIINYEVLDNNNQSRKIEQIGLYRDLDSRIIKELADKNVIKIRYSKEHPVQIEFLIEQQPIQAPALLTKIQ